MITEIAENTQEVAGRYMEEETELFLGGCTD